MYCHILVVLFCLMTVCGSLILVGQQVTTDIDEDLFVFYGTFIGFMHVSISPYFRVPRHLQARDKN